MSHALRLYLLAFRDVSLGGVFVEATLTVRTLDVVGIDDGWRRRTDAAGVTHVLEERFSFFPPVVLFLRLDGKGDSFFNFHYI